MLSLDHTHILFTFQFSKYLVELILIGYSTRKIDYNQCYTDAIKSEFMS